ncbi:triphosphoribosyl-dephospho-CoA synthase MdcB [Rhodoplanes roseus]|uniref:triphosphoribosyl-dephospho-CoA synthase MdcB n=1 Tax=Rhodoplanes roseus TaxID=29409 RepID=UPI001FE20225|nr:triphosphoribosyl-dephospho-CoA synthase MdcB [Rhodoplanes roseus]
MGLSSVLPETPVVPALLDGAAWRIGSATLTGLLLEVCSHPKPGLVTPRSMGAHEDMDVRTFMLSSAAIAPCLYQCAALGRAHRGAPVRLLSAVRAVGREHDAALLAATNGVNTQRGALFCAGLLAAAAGCVSRATDALSADDVLRTVGEITEGLCERELRRNAGEPRTAGEILFRRHGTLGIRGEVEAGFPSVVDCGLPALRTALAAGHGLDRALVHALVALIAISEDTTVMWRGGPEALDFVRAEARHVMDLGGALTPEGVAAIHRLDEACIARRISPGGSADLLSVTVGTHLLEHPAFPQTATRGFCLDGDRHHPKPDGDRR